MQLNKFLVLLKYEELVNIGKIIDLTGHKYGKLTVLKMADKKGKNQECYWLCECDCENKTKKIISGNNLRHGRTKSCGCGKAKTHDLSKSRVYKIYRSMIQRCYNPNAHAYEIYGGRGIKICDEWIDKKEGFVRFYNWSMNNGYSDNLTIDRINVNGNYEPNNCKWSTMKDQQNNKRTNTLIEIDGEIKNIRQWADEFGLTHALISQRLKSGVVGRDLLKLPEKRTSEKQSGHRGILWDKERNLWIVRIKGKYIGRFEQLEEAIAEKNNYIKLSNGE
jgi:hypothetical protein